MSNDSMVIVDQLAEVDETYRRLVALVHGPRADEATAYEVELALFRSLLALGAQLLAVFFARRAAAESAGQVVDVDGATLCFHSWRSVTYLSVFGPIRLRRRYYKFPAGRGRCPLDAALALPARRYSDLLRDWLEYALANDTYDQSLALIRRILGLEIAKHALERLAGEDAQDVEAFYEQQAPPAPADEGSILVVQIDGKGVRMLPEATEEITTASHRCAKKEAVVTTIHTIESHAAHPEAIGDTLVGNPVDTAYVGPKPERPEPATKKLRATLGGKDVAFTRVARDVARRDGDHIRHRVALTDGDKALQDHVRTFLPGFTLVLDVVHVKDYLMAAGVALHGEGSPRMRDWVACRLIEILDGRVNQAIKTINLTTAARPRTPAVYESVDATTRYLTNNADYMHYDDYLANGWPIATSYAEGACKHLVKDRMERAGMRWRPPGAQAVLDLRAVQINQDWDDYQAFHRQCEHHRLYGQRGPTSTCPEEAITDRAA